MKRITLYRDDSTAQVVYENVKTFFWTADNTILTIAVFTGQGTEHFYVHWPRERVCWFKHEPSPDKAIREWKQP